MSALKGVLHHAQAWSIVDQDRLPAHPCQAQGRHRSDHDEPGRAAELILSEEHLPELMHTIQSVPQVGGGAGARAGHRARARLAPGTFR